MQTICTWTFLNFIAILLHSDHGLRGEIQVFQSPDVINVTEGDSVQLNCTFELNQEVGQVSWRRTSGNLELSVQNLFYQSRIQKSGPKLFAQNMAFIRINNVVKMDSDFYYCEVEIAGFGSGNGTGTQLIVTDRKVIDCPPATMATKDHLQPLILAFLGLSILIMMPLIARIYYQHKVISRLGRAQMVTLASRSDYVYDSIDFQETSAGSRQGTTVPHDYNAPVPEYSTVDAPSAIKRSYPPYQCITFTQSTLQ